MRRRIKTRANVFLIWALCVLFCEASTVFSESAFTQSIGEVSFSFNDLLPGGVEGGLVFIEIPIKDRFYGPGKTHEDKWRSFFEKVLKRGWNYSSTPFLYWGIPVDPAFLDQSVLSEATSIMPGDRITVRTAEARTSVIIAKHAIHCHPAEGNCLLLAVRKPDQPLVDKPSLVAARYIPACGELCKKQAISLPATTKNRIRDIVVSASGLKFPSDLDARLARERVEVLAGSFTKPGARQYVAYVNLYPEGSAGEGQWATVILDTNFSLLTVLGQRGYLHIVPEALADINRDGLDEIWASFSGFEGGAHGLLYTEALAPVRYDKIMTFSTGL